jgi:hypothetical protein
MSTQVDWSKKFRAVNRRTALQGSTFGNEFSGESEFGGSDIGTLLRLKLPSVQKTPPGKVPPTKKIPPPKKRADHSVFDQAHSPIAMHGESEFGSLFDQISNPKRFWSTAGITGLALGVGAKVLGASTLVATGVGILAIGGIFYIATSTSKAV